jgi:multiple sugar transport system substrate-binding protein
MRPGIQRVGIRPSASAGGLTSSDKPLTIMIGSSGDAETKAAQDAVAAWSAKSGVSASVVAATDLAQQLSQGFARLSAGPLLPQHRPARGLREQRLTKAYGDQLSNKGDFYPSLVKNFTYDNTFFCAPKDFSTLQLVINENLWTKGLTDADIPTTWDQLAAVAAKLTSGTTKASSSAASTPVSAPSWRRPAAASSRRTERPPKPTATPT